ncbi:MAG TPA: hypothetical protein VK078_06405 [Pseudogracilibacillus sp.]|nr:hypothetical protein [Pseudogracilibacillus sp.]
MNIVLIIVSVLLIITGIIYFSMCKKRYKGSNDEEEMLHIKNCKGLVSIGIIGLFLITAANFFNLL